jgi:hypothetical protein
MGQWALIKQTERCKGHEIDEPVVYDGLEAFAKSQYDPNQIQHVLGKKSLFTYDFNYCPLNRKGRMSSFQKKVRDYQYSTIGKYPPRAIRASSAEIFRRIYEKRKNKQAPLVLHSDEHFQYKRAIRRDLKGLEIAHFTTSSKDYRNYLNELFPVNHLDMLIRHRVCAYKRETIAFAKTPQRMILKYALFMVFKNFMSPQFVSPHKEDPECNKQSPAMRLGITSKILEFYEFFDLRRTLKQVKVNREWECFCREILTYRRQPRVATVMP